jgi:glycerol-3-phosphate acyltransferase PlsX
MGSDTSPKVLFEAVERAAELLGPTHTLLVAATQEIIDQIAPRAQRINEGHKTARIEFHLARDVITMGDEPLTGIRHKKESSLVKTVRLLRKKMVDAIVTAGNTGALIALSTLSLPLLPGIKRPALLALIPTEKGPVAVVDVGGSVYCKAKHLIQFAQMGSAYQRCSQGIDKPRVGILNIGVESKKGTSEHQEAYRILQDPSNTDHFAFAGNVEGREIFQGNVDVLITDGFTGNVLLKTIEGTSAYILDYIRKNSEGKMEPIVSGLRKHLDYTEYPGAIVAGVDGVVVKCHGNATPTSFFHSIKGAAHLVERQLVSKMKAQLTIST